MRQTQNDMVLDMLLTFRGGITATDARRDIGCDRLAARICDLRNQGHWIDTNMVKVPTRHGTALVARYRLINTRGEKV